MGAVNDWRTKILLDTGANISAVSESFARKLRLRRRVSLDKKIDIQGIAKDKVYTQERAKIKLTLGWELVYEFEVWIMPHYAGLAFAAATDGQLSDKERLLYEEWLAQQPLAVERRTYAAPGAVRSRPLGAPHGPICEEQRKQLDERTGTDDGTKNGVIDEVSSNQTDSSISEEVNASSCPLDAGEHDDLPHDKHQAWEPGGYRSANEGINATGQPPELVRGTFLDGMGGVPEPVYVTVAGLQEMDDEITDSTTDDPLADLHLRYAASADALLKDMDSGNSDEFEYEGNEIHFEDYAHELAFLPALTVPASTILDYDAANVKNPTLDPIAQLKLVETLRRHEEIMIANGNALPPPAYGAYWRQGLSPSQAAHGPRRS
ncbi:unnamed protein product [Phytophthora fragariaefolia]|uniref:Unnamed protein product n=1 Tax=Phytophthora fragariaefolia TaxID=1490495 RepID=A0A9W7DAK7_9STRA|nr:unnamed protein product [Phytophthora fragariaefolia]